MRMATVRSAGAAAVLAVTLSACAALPSVSAAPAKPAPGAPAIPAPSTTRTVTLGSESGPRTAVVHRPAGSRRTMPLVVVLHGAYGSGEQSRASLGWDALADRDGFVVAYPNGAGRTWNAGRCCGPANSRKVDDVGFLHRLVEQLVVSDGVDPHRVYAVGMSNGAMMAYAWACGRPDDLAGIGPVSGALVADCRASPGLTVVAVHGTADRNVPINGGVGPKSVTRFSYPPLTSSLAPFVAADRCGPAPRRNDKPPVRVSTWNCAGGTVTLAVIDGMGHDWPGARLSDPLRRALRETAPLDATSFLWLHLRTTAAS